MKNTFNALVAATALSACVAPSAPLVGGDLDTRGCIGSAGQSWSVLKQACVQPWQAADLKLDDLPTIPWPCM